MVATQLMRWSWQLTDEQRGGLTTRPFTRSGYHLHLRVGRLAPAGLRPQQGASVTLIKLIFADPFTARKGRCDSKKSAPSAFLQPLRVSVPHHSA